MDPDELAALTRLHRTLEDVLRWGLALTPPALVTEVVTQDEFTHDVIVGYRDIFLVYDTT